MMNRVQLIQPQHSSISYLQGMVFRLDCPFSWYARLVAALWYREWSRTQHIKLTLTKVTQEQLMTNIFNLLWMRVGEFVTVQTVQVSTASLSLHVDPNFITLDI